MFNAVSHAQEAIPSVSRASSHPTPTSFVLGFASHRRWNSVTNAGMVKVVRTETGTRLVLGSVGVGAFDGIMPRTGSDELSAENAEGADTFSYAGPSAISAPLETSRKPPM